MSEWAVVKIANVMTLALLIGSAFVLGYKRERDGVNPWQKGMKLVLTGTGINFAQARRTLIIVHQQTCEYCRESLPFYKEVVDARRKESASLQIVILVPPHELDAERYFTDQGVTPDRIVYGSVGNLPVKVTPTLVLADATGAVEELWPGFLSTALQRDVLAALF